MTVYSVTQSCDERISRRFSRENAFVQKNLLDNIKNFCPKKAFPDDCPSFKNFCAIIKTKRVFHS